MSKLKAMVLSVGVVNMTTGKTQYDWSIYENQGLQAFLIQAPSHFLLFGAKESFKIGDEVDLISNDSNRRLGKTGAIKDIATCTKEELLPMLLKHGFDYYPSRPFQKKKGSSSFRGPAKLTTSFSVKGITNI